MELRLTLEGGRKMKVRLTLECGRGRCHSGGFLLRIMPPSWQPVPACTSNGHSAGVLFFAAATTAAGGPFNTATTGYRRRNYSSLRQRKLESDASPFRQILLQARYSTCRNDGTAVILDFRPRIGNRCSYEDHFGDFRTAILDLRGSIWQSLQLRGSFRGLPCSDS